MNRREPIRCDCCGTVVCAQSDGERVIIRQRKHGRDHYAVVTIDRHSPHEENSVEKTESSASG